MYAFPLATKGYSVHLIDPVELHVEQASAKSASQSGTALAGAQVGDARRLAFGDGSADAVLLLGSLYHLTTHNDRIQAVQEAHRVLRPGSLMFAAAISRFASTYDGLFGGYLVVPQFEKIVERDIAEGQHRKPSERYGWCVRLFVANPRLLAADCGCYIQENERYILTFLTLRYRIGGYSKIGEAQ